MRLLFGQSLSSGYGVGSPDRLFGFSSYSKRSRSAAIHFTSLNYFWRKEGFVCRTRMGLNCWIYLIGLKKLVIFV